MRIAWFSNSPGVPTGYGVQTTSVCNRLAADGHDVHVIGNFGHRAGVRQMPSGVKVWPEGIYNYSLDTAADHAKRIDADVVITLYDVWVLPPETFADRRVLSWTPIDHQQPPPDVLRWARAHDTIAMSEFGARALRAHGVEPIATIPHTVEAEFRPGPRDRSETGIPDEAFLVAINAANIGNTPPRKAWAENMRAMAALMKAHDDAWLFLHTDMARPNGVSLPVMIEAFGLDKDRLRIVDPLSYRDGTIDEKSVARMYDIADVTLAVSKGEGFGVPVIESMACGTPCIVSEFSAQPELVADLGWRVNGQLDWDHNQGADFFAPFHGSDIYGLPIPGSIEEQLEAAYAERGTEAAAARRAACAERATRWYADDVYDQHWRPLIASIEATPAPPRKGMSRGSQKRAKKAAA